MRYKSLDISEILVTLVDGRQMIYKGKGIPNLTRILMEDIKPKKEEKIQIKNGYSSMDLNYSPSLDGKNPNDAAKELMKQAENATNIRYG